MWIIFIQMLQKLCFTILPFRKKKNPQIPPFLAQKFLCTLGVEIEGKKLSNDMLKPFASVDELIEFKNAMRKPPKNNVPINIFKSQNTL